MDPDDFRDIDEQISTLEMKLVSLRKQRNGLVLFCRLPPEVVLSIFHFAKELERNHDDLLQDIFYSSSRFITPSRDELDISWVYLMSVCARFRDIALGSCELWQSEGVQVPGNAQWRDLCIKRADNLSTSFIHCSTSDECCNERSRVVRNAAMRLAIEHLPLATEAHLLVSPPDILNEGDASLVDELLQTLEHSCDQLTYLRICWGQFVFHDRVLGGVSHSVTTLILSDIHFLETWPTFMNLRNLMISYSTSHDARVHRRNLLRWLSNLEILEVLAIQSNYYYRHDDDSLDQSLPKAIILPRLRILRIEDSSFDVLSLMRILSEPSHGLDITIEWDSYSYHDGLEQDNEERRYSAEYVAVMEKLIIFWSTHRMDWQLSALVGAIQLIASEEYSSYLHIGENAKILLCSTPYDCYVDTSKPFCRFVGPCLAPDTNLPPCSNLIDALFLKENYHCSMTRLNLYQWRLLLELLSVEVVYLEDPDDYCHMSTQMPDHDLPDNSEEYSLINWLKARKLNSRAIRQLLVGTITNREACTAMQVMATELVTEQIVQNVKWL